MGVIRKPHSNSGLIRQEVRSDPRGDHPDWPKLIREMLATEKPDFIVMMIGLNDRRPIREQRPPRPADRRARSAWRKSGGRSEKGARGARSSSRRSSNRAGEAAAELSRAHLRVPLGKVGRALYQADRRDDRGAEIGGRPGIPGRPAARPRGAVDRRFQLPQRLVPQPRRQRPASSMSMSGTGSSTKRAIIALYGPDVEGQNRRLRTPDGIYFTQAGARKLAHFLERELQRWMTARSNSGRAPGGRAGEQGGGAAAKARFACRENPPARWAGDFAHRGPTDRRG